MGAGSPVTTSPVDPRSDSTTRCVSVPSAFSSRKKSDVAGSFHMTHSGVTPSS